MHPVLNSLPHRWSSDGAPAPCTLPPLGLCIVESSPIRYPVTKGTLGRPRRFGCFCRRRACSAFTRGSIAGRQSLSHCLAVSRSSQGAYKRKRLSPARLLASATCRNSPSSVRRPSTPASTPPVRSRSTAIAVSSTTGDSVRQSDTTHHPGIEWERALDISVASRVAIHPCNTTRCPFLRSLLAQSIELNIYRRGISENFC